jgi:ubiquitin-conjugating enzyme E2 J2
MITPSGRFQVNTRLCLSISDYHPDTWNPSWTVSTIIMGLLSFMNETAPTLGSLTTTETEKRLLARRSRDFNLADKQFCEIFPEMASALKAEVERERREAEAALAGAAGRVGSSERWVGVFESWGVIFKISKI